MLRRPPIVEHVEYVHCKFRNELLDIYGSLSVRFPAYNLCCTVASDRLIESLGATVKSLDLAVEGAEELPGVVSDELCS